MTRVPVLVLGDGPNMQSGLARIARQLTSLLSQHSEELGIEVAQAGLRYDGSPWPWRVFPIHDEANWGRGDIGNVWEWFLGPREAGVLFSVWDPSRCFGTSEVKLRGCSRWGYFPVDSYSRQGYISGPAGVALTRYQRVLGYGAWGSRVLAKTLNKDSLPWLPHGLAEPWTLVSPGEKAPAPMLGCVAANQPRKDFGLFFRAADLLRKKWKDLCLWIHTDRPIGEAWSIPQLASDFDFDDQGALLVSTDLDDESLVQLYSRCWVTFAPGLGEGFGYPIVESLACGTPVVHGTFGGGRELIPVEGWTVLPKLTRLEGAYAQYRPVYDPVDVMLALDRILKSYGERETQEIQAYCQGQVKYLNWDYLWLRWKPWFARGLRELREGATK